MVFASGIFLYGFLPLFLALYFLTPNRWRPLFIALASYVFYGWWRPDFVLLMLFSTLVDFHCGKAIERDQARGLKGKRWVTTSVVVNLGLLGYFKYANFGVDSLNAILTGFGMETIAWTEIVLPIGISFYTFQTISYTVDVYRGHARTVDRFIDFMCYVAMFPQLVAGPIVRYNTVADQLRERTHTLDKFYRGVLFFQVGFAKKVLVADILGQIVDAAFRAPSLTCTDAWLGSTAFTFQVYFDFSGYSDMAIGLGLMMGFRLPVNFDQPYVTTSFHEYWRGWHLSLSNFLRDYLYIPLGGNRKGSFRTYVNLMTTMLLGGLWHGAAWNQVLWGGFNGLFLAIERAMGRKTFYRFLPRGLQMLATFALVTFGLAIFRTEGMAHAGHYLATMLGFAENAVAPEDLIIRRIHLLVFAIAIYITWFTRTSQALLASPSRSFALAVQPMFLLALVQLHYQDFVPFLYFQF